MRVTQLEGELVKGKKTVAELQAKLKAADKLAEPVVYKRDGLQACLQQSQSRHNKAGESITRV